MKEQNKWVCDNCNEIIETPQDGYLEWLTNPHRDLKIVHHKSPNYSECSNPEATTRPLRSCFEKSGLMNILELLSNDDFSKNDVIETLKRLYIIGYDECRNYFKGALDAGIIQKNSLDGFYTPHQIETVLNWKKDIS